jgi:GNAT superfamily N-acetyltransferase
LTTLVFIQRPKGEELAALFNAVGWGENSAASLESSVAAYPCTICARAEAGELVGYLSAFSDQVMSTMIGELVVHPHWRHQGIAKAMLAVLRSNIPTLLSTSRRSVSRRTSSLLSATKYPRLNSQSCSSVPVPCSYGQVFFQELGASPVKLNHLLEVRSSCL